MKKYAIIVAGGKGMRMNSDIPKQFLCIDGKPILMETITRFSKVDDLQLIVVLPEDEIGNWKNLCKKYHFDVGHRIVKGGNTRFHSVKNGLDSIDGEEGIVAVHDGVRPFVSPELINKLIREAADHESAVPFTFPKESIRVMENGISRHVNRNDYRMIQTPQCFDIKKLKAAYQQEYTEMFTDDASVFESKNNTIHLVEGEYSNIKITTQEDLK